MSNLEWSPETLMTRRTKAIAFINLAAGGVGAGGLEHMRSVLCEIGIAADIRPINLSKIQQQFDQLSDSDCEKIIVWGGDGTHRTALRRPRKKSDTLVLLPGGTMNPLSKWVHGDQSWREILRDVFASSRLPQSCRSTALATSSMPWIGASYARRRTSPRGSHAGYSAKMVAGLDEPGGRPVLSKPVSLLEPARTLRTVLEERR